MLCVTTPPVYYFFFSFNKGLLRGNTNFFFPSYNNIIAAGPSHEYFLDASFTATKNMKLLVFNVRYPSKTWSNEFFELKIKELSTFFENENNYQAVVSVQLNDGYTHGWFDSFLTSEVDILS